MKRFVTLCVLCALALCLGCKKEEPEKKEGLDINFPGGSVRVGDEGVQVEAPGVNVDANKEKVKVKAPNVDVEVENK